MKRLVVTGLNHKTTPLELRERFALAPNRLPEALHNLMSSPDIHEGTILSTCNRVEIYTLETWHEGPHSPSLNFFEAYFGVPRLDLVSHLYRHVEEAAVEHLFSVAASLDSMIVGEPQILGQVKEAYTVAQREGAAGPVFHRLFTQALHVGKRVRHETDIGRHAVSVPYAAVELAKKVFDDVTGKCVVVIGRGDMSELALRHLANAGAGQLVVVGRCFGHACKFAKSIPGASARPYDRELRFLDSADIVLASTRAPHWLIDAPAVRELMRRRRNRLLLLIDISVPRVIDQAVNDIDNVYLFNIDHLQHLVAANYSLRLDAAAKARHLISQEVHEFMQWLAGRDLVPTIQAFREHLARLLDEEMKRTLGKLGPLEPQQRSAIEHFGRSLINKICHSPIHCLKNQQDPYSAAVFREALLKLFELEHTEH